MPKPKGEWLFRNAWGEKVGGTRSVCSSFHCVMVTAMAQADWLYGVLTDYSVPSQHFDSRTNDILYYSPFPGASKRALF